MASLPICRSISWEVNEMSDRNLLSKRIVEAVYQMPTQVRRVFVLSHYRGLSLQEIAGSLGIKEKEAESLLRWGNTFFHRTLTVS
jgi:DNA-directed RNA polymerase specialized sigma24 family protein